MKYVIFYIDDEADLLEIFVESYASEDFDVRIFTDPQQLLAALDDRTSNQILPDLILIDFRLPGTNGDQLAQEIDRKLNATVPKVLITGDLRIASTARFIKVFSKPYDPEDMQRFLDSGEWRRSRSTAEPR